MNWKITCYNGDIWTAPYQMSLSAALELWERKTGNVQISIKIVENLH